MNNKYSIGDYLLFTIPINKEVVGRIIHITTVNNVQFAIVWIEEGITHSYSFSDLDKVVNLTW